MNILLNSNVCIILITFICISDCHKVSIRNVQDNFYNQSKETMHRVKRQIFVPSSRNILQHQFADNTNFVCDPRHGARSKSIPNSVHMLTPGDIDVVGALGDSLTVGTGAFAATPFGILMDGKGVSFSIGGQSTWNHFLTLPNILKLYNPNIYGYSLNQNPSTSIKSSIFNVAENGAINAKGVMQAKILVNRMHSDKNVNIQKHWKLITYLFGGNDFCMKICLSSNPNIVVENSKKDLINTLRILKQYLPRTLVNVLLPPDVSILTKIRNAPYQCQLVHLLTCSCMFNSQFSQRRGKLLDILNQWKKGMEEVVKLPEFHDSLDFEVNIHRFFDKGDIPRYSNGDTNFSYLSADCFHFSQKGHSLVANALWNSMLTPENQRLRYFKKEFEEFKCPTELTPYLATIKNS